LKSSFKNQQGIIDRVRLSQKMAEQRELKLKNFIDGRKDLNVDNGDHGIQQGFVRRKGLGQLSSQLDYLMQGS